MTLLALPALFPAGASARLSAWRIASYSLTFTEHATAMSSPCDVAYDGPAAGVTLRAATEDARFTLSGGRSREPLFMYDYLARGPASRGMIDPGGALTERRQLTQSVVDCDTGQTSARACDASSAYLGGNAETWGLIESMTPHRRRQRVTIRWGFTPVDGYDCDGALGLGPPVALNSLVKTQVPVGAFYHRQATIHFSRTWSGDDAFSAQGTQTLEGTLILRRTTLPGSCYPGRRPDRHFVCTRG